MPLHPHGRYDGAQCASPIHNPDWWFADPSAAATNADRVTARAEVRRARQLCQACPVRAHCLDDFVYGPTTPRFGIWAGLNPAQRHTARRNRALAAALATARPHPP